MEYENIDDAPGLVSTWFANYECINAGTFRRMASPHDYDTAEAADVRLPKIERIDVPNGRPFVQVTVERPKGAEPHDGELAMRLCDEALLAAYPGRSIMRR